MFRLATFLRAVLILSLAFGVLAALQLRTSREISGLARAIDGDTLELLGERIRLEGMDAPELLQTCLDEHGRSWPCGREAKTALAKLVSLGVTRCTAFAKDRYGRSIAQCEVDASDLGAAIVERGLAVSKNLYPEAEYRARMAKIGLHRGRFDDPADWRVRHGPDAVQ